MSQYSIWAIWWLRDFENLGRKYEFHNFRIVGKQSDIDNRLDKLYGKFKCFGNALKWTVHITHRLNLQLLQKYDICKILCLTNGRHIQVTLNLFCWVSYYTKQYNYKKEKIRQTILALKWYLCVNMTKLVVMSLMYHCIYGAFISFWKSVLIYL